MQEAIEFLEHMINKKDSEWEIRVYGELLEVLKRGEKYEKMWEELENEGKNYSYSYIATTKWLMDNIKQKYFPKGK